jgi:hypothetical protein
MLYAQMTYMVCDGSAYSDIFKLLVGILAGNSAFPTLWNIFFVDLDLWIPIAPSNIVLGGSMYHMKNRLMTLCSLQPTPML